MLTAQHWLVEIQLFIGRVKYERVDQPTDSEPVQAEPEIWENMSTSAGTENAGNVYYCTGIEVQQEDLASIQVSL